MKLLVIGHSYLTAFAQQNKYLPMKQLDENLQLRIVTPGKLHHVFKTYTQEIAEGMHPDEIQVIKPVWGKSHMTYLLNPLRLAALLRRFRPDHIHIEEDPHSVVGMETILLVRLLAPKAKVSFFIWDNLARQPKFPLNLVKWGMTKFSLSRANLVVCGNQEGQRLLHTVKDYRGQSVVLPQLGIDPHDYDTPAPPKLLQELVGDEGTPLIGFLGRLVPEKGVLLLLEALAALQDLSWRVLIVGAGPLKEEILTKWQPLFGDRLIYRDAIPHKEVSEYLKCLDIFVLPSYAIPGWKEQFGVTLAQAMMAGVACIGSSSGAISEVIGQGGLIFQERDKASLTQALESLIKSPGDRKKFGLAAREIALVRYGNVAVAKKYLTALNRDDKKGDNKMKSAVAQFYWSQLSKAQNVLDLGCASGELGKYKPKGVKIHGLDLNTNLVSQAEPYYESVKVWDLDQPQPLPFPDAYFDAVIAKDILEHLQKPWCTLAEIKRVLKPGGYVLASVITHRSYRTWSDYTHVRGFTKQSLRQMFTDSGLKVHEIWPMGGIPLTSRLKAVKYIPWLLRFPPFDWFWTSSYEIKAQLS